MTTYEKIVKGATKIKVAAPKLKYIEPILLATSVHHSTEIENFGTIMRTLQTRLQDSAWSVVYKSLIVIHIMIREGDKDYTLKYIGEKMPHLLNLDQATVSRGSGFNNDVKFILKYAKYLQTRVKQYQQTKVDYVRDERSNNSTDQQGGRLRSLTVEKGLLRESESVQKQIDALLKNNFMENDINNDILLTSFRLLVNDLLSLFQELNEGVINLLEHYFEMSKVDAERALKIYKKFVDQTKYVIDYLRVAKHLEHSTKLHVPTIKHAPTALTSSLEEYLDDPNFDANRRQYLIEKQLKKEGKASPTKVPNLLTKPQESQPPSQQQAQVQPQRANSLVVQQTYNPWEQVMQQPFANSIVTHTGEVFTMPSIAQGQQIQLNSPFGNQPQVFQQPTQPSLNPAFTGNGFGGYGPQVQQSQATGNNPFLQNVNDNQVQSQVQPFMQQQQTQQFIQPQQTQPFGQQQPQPFMQPQQPQPFDQQQLQQSNPQLTQQNTFGLNRSNTNPFSMSNGTSPQPINPQSTNPFGNTRFSSGSNTTALSFNNGSKPEPIKATATGSNPFKVSETTSSLFNSAANVQPQQIRPQPTAGGLENLPTVPVFPQTQQEQQKQQYLNNAKMELQMTGQQPLQQQQTQPFQPFQQQTTQNFQPFQQQPTQSFQPFQQQQTTQNGQPFQQQPAQAFQPFQEQPTQNFQQQPLYANNTYNGPSLI